MLPHTHCLSHTRAHTHTRGGRLQEELDAYDTRQMELEDEMDKKTSALISLQRLAMEQVSHARTHTHTFTHAHTHTPA